MTFEFHGTRYRVGFRHEKSRRWEDHDGPKHEIGFSTPIVAQVGKGVRHSGPIELWCNTCGLKLSHLTRAERARNVHCTIWVQEGTQQVPPAGFSAEGGKEWPLWKTVAQGQSHLNVQAGDQYDREKGRVAALRDALDKWLKIPNVAMGGGASDFRAALWAWFLHGRKRSAVERAAAKRV